MKWGQDGRAKLRYVGGWTIKKLIDNTRRYFNENKMSQSGRVRTRINKEIMKLQLLENNIDVSHECAQISSAYPETLDLIEFRQYRGRGLIHISDDAFEFFMLLEQERVNKINTDRLSSLQNSMVDDCITKCVENSILQAAFVGLFRPDGDANKVFTNKNTCLSIKIVLSFLTSFMPPSYNMIPPAGVVPRGGGLEGATPLRKNHMKKPTCESRVKLEQHFTCDPHVVKTHVIHMWNTCDFTVGDF